jgi:hypothetical protein
VKSFYADLSQRQRFTHLMNNQNLCTSLRLIGFLSIDPQLVAHANQVEQKNFNAICRLTINRKTYLDGPCKYEHASGLNESDYFRDNRVAIECQPNGSGPCYVSTPGVFGYLTPSSKGDARLCWNEMGSAHAQTCFLRLRRTGACWLNPAATSLFSSQLKADIRFCAWAR